MAWDRGEFLAEFEASPPAAPDTLSEAESAFRIALTDDFKAFVLAHDGGEGFVGEHYLVIVKAAELATFNVEYGFPEYAPAFVGFGSDGGGEAFAFDTRRFPYRL